MEEEEYEFNANILHNISFMSHDTNICSGVVSCSEDGSFAIIQDQGISVFQMKSMALDCTTGILCSTTNVKNPTAVSSYDVDVQTNSFIRDPSVFPGSSTFVLDPILNPRPEGSHFTKGYMKAVWSPVGFTMDGRSLLSLITFDGQLAILRLKKIVGKWAIMANLTEFHWAKLSQNNFDIDCKKVPGFDDGLRALKAKEWKSLHISKSKDRDIQESFLLYKDRKYHMYTTAVCWCPNVKMGIKGLDNLPNQKLNKDTCMVFLASATKSGLIVFWLLTVDNTTNHTEINILDEYDTGNVGIVSAMKWYQPLNKDTGYLVIAYTNGNLDLFVVETSLTDNGACVVISAVVPLWNDDDDIMIYYIEGMFKGENLQIAASKNDRILIFDVISSNSGQLHSQYRVGPRLLDSAMCGMSFCGNGKVYSASSNGKIMCLDVDSFKSHEVANVMRKGYLCVGFVTLPHAMICIAVLTPFKVMMKQRRCPRKAEIVFIPVVPVQTGAQIFTDETSRLSTEMQEYFRAHLSTGGEVPTELKNYFQRYENRLHISEGLDYQKLAFLSWLLWAYSLALRECDPAEEDASKVEYWESMSQKTFMLLTEYLLTNRVKRWIQYQEESRELVQAEDAKILLLHLSWLLTYGTSEEIQVVAQTCSRILNQDGYPITLPVKKDSTMDSWTRYLTFKGTTGLQKKGAEVHSAADGGASSSERDTESGVDSEVDSRKQSDRTLVSSAISLVKEKCPLCQDDVTFINVSEGRCLQGHRWNRCCLTLTILTDFASRQCIGCGKYAGFKETKRTQSFRSTLLDNDHCSFCNGWLISRMR